jgi:hypothetical protein
MLKVRHIAYSGQSPLEGTNKSLVLFLSISLEVGFLAAGGAKLDGFNLQEDLTNYEQRQKGKKKHFLALYLGAGCKTPSEIDRKLKLRMGLEGNCQIYICSEARDLSKDQDAFIENWSSKIAHFG